MTDVRLLVSDVVFALRAVLLCVRHGKLLVEASPGVPFVNLPGGAVNTLEDLHAAAAREWNEETGLKAENLRLVGLVENFFEMGGRRWHELGAYFTVDAPAGLEDSAMITLDNPKNLLDWVKPFEHSQKPIYPVAAKDLLGVPVGGFRHIVNWEGEMRPGQDLRLDVGGVNVQVRVHLIYVQGGKLLTNTEPGSGFWFLPGGSVLLNEDSLTAARREFQEETGVQAGQARLVGITEGFDRTGKRQQLGLVYRIEASEPLPVHSYPVQDAPGAELQWVPLSDVDVLPVHPEGLSQFLGVPEGKIAHNVLEWSVTREV